MPHAHDDHSIAGYITKRLRFLHVNQVRLAARLNVHPSTVTRWLREPSPIGLAQVDCLALALASPVWPDPDRDTAIIDGVRAQGLGYLHEVDGELPRDEIARVHEHLLWLLKARGQGVPPSPRTALDADLPALASLAEARWSDLVPDGLSDDVGRLMRNAVHRERTTVEGILRRHAVGRFVTRDGHFALLKEIFRQPGRHEVRMASTAGEAHWWVSMQGQALHDIMVRTEHLDVEQVFSVGSTATLPELVIDRVMQVQRAMGIRVLRNEVAPGDRGTRSNVVLLDARFGAIGDGTTFVWTTDDDGLTEVRNRYDALFAFARPVETHAVIEFEGRELAVEEAGDRGARDAFLDVMRARLELAAV